MNNDFGIPVLPLIKLFVRDHGVVEGDLVGDDEARLGPPRDDEVAEIAVVGFDVALAGAE